MGQQGTKLTKEQIMGLQTKTKGFLSQQDIEEYYKLFQTQYNSGNLTKEKFIQSFEPLSSTTPTSNIAKNKEFWGQVFDSFIRTDVAFQRNRMYNSQDAPPSTAAVNTEALQFEQLLNICSLSKGNDMEKLEFGFHFMGGSTFFQDHENSHIEYDALLKNLKAVYQMIGEKYIKELPQHIQTPEAATHLAYRKIKAQPVSPLFTIGEKKKAVCSKKQFMQHCIATLDYKIPPLEEETTERTEEAESHM